MTKWYYNLSHCHLRSYRLQMSLAIACVCVLVCVCVWQSSKSQPKCVVSKSLQPKQNITQGPTSQFPARHVRKYKEQIMKSISRSVRSQETFRNVLN